MQLLAMLTMLLDHVGIMFFPEESIWRVIGRIAFPIYAFGVVQGFKHTSDMKKYMYRLIVLGSISQIPFMLALKQQLINVIGTFAVCLMVLILITYFKGYIAKFLVIGAAAIMLEVLPFDYGCYALLLILIFYWSKHIILMHFILNAVFLPFIPLQVFSIVSTLFLVLCPRMNLIRIPQWLWRSFYPVHLALLAVVASIYF